MPDWVLPALAFIGGAFGTWILIRLRFERFEAMDTRRERDWQQWRDDIDDRVRDIEKRPFIGAFMERLDTFEKKLELHFHDDREQYGKINTILERIENVRREIEAMKGRRRS
jgi:hypothetical protein